MKIFKKLKDGIFRSSKKMYEGFSQIFSIKKKIDLTTLDSIEELLIESDFGAIFADKFRSNLEKLREKEINANIAISALKKEIISVFELCKELDTKEFQYKPHVILMIGVNGSGKTTTLAKIANQFASQGKKVAIAACDTFRAAAEDQLTVWANGIPSCDIYKSFGSDPASLVFDSYKKSKESGADVLLIDTAGRLQNNKNLMNELNKMMRVIKKIDDSAPHEILLVLDGTVGQNAIAQVEIFNEFTDISSIIITKLDGTTKGGILVPIVDKFKIPISYVCSGEKIDDIYEFNVDKFVDDLLQ